MKWNEEYSLGIEEIDSQHKELLRLFSIVQDEVRTEQRWSSIHYSIVEIIDFSQFHFGFEEALMRLYGFPGYEEHRKVHGQLLGKADELLGESMKGGARDDIAKFFGDWLVEHMKRADRGYAQHILAGAKVVGSARVGQGHNSASVSSDRNMA